MKLLRKFELKAKCVKQQPCLQSVSRCEHQQLRSNLIDWVQVVVYTLQ